MCQPITKNETSTTGSDMDQRLNNIFEKQVRETPDEIAIETFDGVILTYRQLDDIANGICSNLLQKLSVKPGNLVAVFVERGTPNVYAAILGILKAGCAYLPMDVSFPDARISYMLADSGATALITSHTARNIQFENPNMTLPILKMNVSGSVPCLSTECVMATSESSRDVLHMQELCYIIYTSGTTGNPKGVMLSQSNAMHYVGCLRQLFRLKPTDRVFQGYSTAFDAAFGEVWMAFSSGATLVVATLEAMQNLADLHKCLRQKKISVLDTTPTNLQVMDPSASDALPELHTVIVGGEACPRFVVDRWQIPGKRRFFNMYGPTETTVSATIAELHANMPVTIGKALPGYTVSVRDENLVALQDGQEGELCIGGPGVALGYLNQPEKTAERFVNINGERLYRTGDLVVIDPQGEIIFKGRADGQVKLRGFRIELEEIETTLAASSGCAQVAVAVQNNIRNESVQELVAFICEHPDKPFDIQQARKQIQRDWPKCCMPQAFVRIASDALPRSLVSGKVLRKQLPHWTTLERIQVGGAKCTSEISTTASVHLTVTEQKLNSLFLDVLSENLAPSANYFDHDLNS